MNFAYIEKIKSDYEKAEITCLFLHEKDTNSFSNLFTIIELIPSEQASSDEIGKEQNSFLVGERIDKNLMLYIGRAIDLNTDHGILAFTDTNNLIKLNYKTLDCVVKPFPFANLEVEPPDGNPVLINGQSEKTFGNILPFRNTDFRVWSKLDRSKLWLNKFDNKTRAALYKQSGKLTLTHLSFDISKIPEHFGNIYMCCCNPYLRSYQATLLDYNTDLLISLKERMGKTIVGKKLVLQEKRAENIGFTVEKVISGASERIKLPYLPAQLITQLYDSNGFLLEHHLGTWINISFGMEMQHSTMNLQVKSGDEVKTFKIEKYVREKPVTIGKYDHSLSRYLWEAKQKREFKILESNKDFVFFPGSEGDKEKAQTIITDILNCAHDRIILLDPYFGVADLFYAFVVKRLSVPIRILSSASFLKEKVDKTVISIEPILRHAHNLLKGIQNFPAAYSNQIIECRVLKGGKSPLHDRYIVADDKVYLLGSSFNEFGTRATTLFKVPAPQQMIDQAMEWFSDPEKTDALENFVNCLDKSKENDSQTDS